MTEEALKEKMDLARRIADNAHEKWLDQLTSGDTGPKARWLEEMHHEIWVSSIRSYSALKSNYRRWRVNKTGHKRED